MRKVGSILCLAVAAASVIFALFARRSGGWFFSMAIFHNVENGTFLGLIGNIFGVLLTLGGFAVTGWFGLSKDDKKALISSASMLALCVISLIISICTKDFSFGDILIMVPPALILIDLFRSH